MRGKSSIDIETINAIYSKFKFHIVYSLTIIVALLIFAIFTLPNIFMISSLASQRSVEAEKLKILNSNLNLLRETGESTLDAQLLAVTSALPERKDYEGILNAIAYASGKSGSALEDYNFSVGDLSDAPPATSAYPSIKLVLIIKAGPDRVVSFLKNLSQTVPLSEVIAVSQTAGSATITTLFYYKPSQLIAPSPGAKLEVFSSEDTSLISTLSSWSAVSNFSDSFSATSSASPFSGF